MKNIFFYFFMLMSASVFAQDTYEAINTDLQVIRSGSKADGNDKRVLKLMENMNNEILETGDGLLSDATITLYKSFLEDKTLPNSHIFFLFHLYQTEVENPEAPDDFQLVCMKMLSDACMETYGKLPAIVWIYMGEALMNADKNDEAKAHFAKAIKFYPDSVPINVYSYSLADEGPAKEKLKAILHKKHPDHWFVKDMVK